MWDRDGSGDVWTRKEGMKALSIKQPHADWILYKGKDVENRNWRLPYDMYRQRIYIHAGKCVDAEMTTQAHYEDMPGRLGAIIGEVDIVGCVTIHDSEWFEGPYGFILDNPAAYQTPIPVNGMLGFFEPKIAEFMFT